MILSGDAANRVPFPAPAHYGAHRCQLMAQLLATIETKLGGAPVMEYRPPVTGPGFFQSLYQRYLPGLTLRIQIP